MGVSSLQNTVLRTLGKDPRVALVLLRLCYRPTAFFRHLRLIALLFPHGKIRRAFPKCIFYFNFLFIVFIFYLFFFLFVYFNLIFIPPPAPPPQIVLAWNCLSLGIPLLTVTISVRNDPRGHVAEVTHATVPSPTYATFKLPVECSTLPAQVLRDWSLTRHNLRTS